MLSLMFNSFDIFCKVLNTFFPPTRALAAQLLFGIIRISTAAWARAKKIGGSMVAIELAEPQLFHSVRNRARSQEL